MYYKINKTGCCERRGLVQIRFDCYLDPADSGSEAYNIIVPDYTGAKYAGEITKEGRPVDQKDYDAWVKTLPVISQTNPFCCHFRCFEPDVTDADIVKAGDEIIKMAHANYQADNLQANKNEPVIFNTNIVKIQASLSRVASVKTTDFEAIKVAERETP